MILLVKNQQIKGICWCSWRLARGIRTVYPIRGRADFADTLLRSSLDTCTEKLWVHFFTKTQMRILNPKTNISFLFQNPKTDEVDSLDHMIRSVSLLRSKKSEYRASSMNQTNISYHNLPFGIRTKGHINI